MIETLLAPMAPEAHRSQRRQLYQAQPLREKLTLRYLKPRIVTLRRLYPRFYALYVLRRRLCSLASSRSRRCRFGSAARCSCPPP